MRLLAAEVINFGSYTHLEFEFSNQGLALVYGATGSGKSTLQDIPTWILFGITSKNGNVEEVKNWNFPEGITKGILEVETKDGVIITITRTRGKPNQNDLYWIEHGTTVRGKDINETQILLEKRIGISSELYISAACYNEFSPTSTFFTDKAKDRRELFEKIADLELPTRLLERTSSVKKETRKAIMERTEKINYTDGRLSQLRRTEIEYKRDAEKWSKDQAAILEELQVRSKNFEKEKQSKIDALKTKYDAFELSKSNNITALSKNIESIEVKLKKFKAICPECGQPDQAYTDLVVKREGLRSKLISLQESTNPYDAQLEAAKLLENNYSLNFIRESGKTNPFVSQQTSIAAEINKTEEALKILKNQLDALNHKNLSLNHLSELSSVLRAELLKKAISHVEHETNRYLNSYFDAELRVEFSADNTDNLEVIIRKNGHECSYRQLSKGQRGLLKLCFAVSVMAAAANKESTHFNSLFFDEALDGLDVNLKLKAFSLFSELSLMHDTILVIDHCEELKSLFTKHYHVTLIQDESTIEV